jgi:DNA ligase (NAD+)
MSEIDNVKQQIIELKAEIRKHNKLYYEDDNPLITDLEYDQMMQRLRMLESSWPELSTADSPTMQVGGNVRKSLPAVAHRFPMLSLQSFCYAQVRTRHPDPGVNTW